MQTIKEQIEELIKGAEKMQEENANVEVHDNDENFQDYGGVITVKNYLLDGLKKIISVVAILLFFVNAQAQVTVTFPDLQSALNAMKLNNPGVSKNQLDSGLANKALQSYVFASIAN